MAGSDTIRGIGFQHAYAIQLALDVLDDPESAALTVEGADDVIDVEIARLTTPTRRIFQARSRQEPYNWSPGEIAPVIVAWQDIGGGADAPLTFYSDAPASPETATRLRPALESAHQGALSEEERTYLVAHGIDPDRAAYVEVATRGEGTGALIAMAENRVRRLQSLSGASDSEDAGQAAVDRLFRIFGVEGGEQRIEQRTFSRARLAEVLAVDLEVIDSGSAWDSAAADAYRASASRLDSPHPWIELAALMDRDVATPALALKVRRDATAEGPTVLQSAMTLIDAPGGAGLWGAAGTGKTTTTQQMRAAAAQEHRIAVPITAVGYRRGDVDRRVRRALEDGVGHRLAAASVLGALAESAATVIVDGMSGLATEQEDALAADLLEMRQRFPNLRLIVADRERSFARRFDLPTYALSPLASEERQAIAAGVIDDANRVVADLEKSLADAVDNPLLFTMALALTSVGIAPTSRSEIFAGFLEGLRQRETETTLDEADLAALRLCAVALTSERRYAADRYWWFATIHEALASVRERGLYEVSAGTAEGVLRRLRAVGLLFEDDVAASVSLLHDSFRDYLTSVALVRGEADIPVSIGPEWEVAIELLAEQGRLTPDVARAVSSDNLVAAWRAARFDNAEPDAALIADLTRLLITRHLGVSPVGDSFAVTLFRGEAHNYACIVSEADDCEPPAEAIVEPLAAAALPKAQGSLAFSVVLYRTVLSQLTASRPPALLRPIPATSEELAAAIETHFLEQQSAICATAEQIFPTLADRLLAAVGWTGLRAEVGPSQEVEFFPGQPTTFHGLRYRVGGEGIAVEVVAHEPRENDADPLQYAARSTAESFLDRAPEDEALTALMKAVAELLPEDP